MTALASLPFAAITLAVTGALYAAAHIAVAAWNHRRR